MDTATFKYANDVLNFLEQLMMEGTTQFQVAFHVPSGEWAVSFPPQYATVELGEDIAEEP